MGEQVSMQFRLELFNVFNHANLGDPDSLLESATFGEAQIGRRSVGSWSLNALPLNERPRHVQIGLKIYF